MDYLALLTSLWASLASLLSSIDWLSIGAFLAATGGLGLLGWVWRSRTAIAAKLPWIGAALELLEVFGFSPTALREWVLRRSWYRKGEAETERLVSELSSPSQPPPPTPPAALGLLLVMLGGTICGLLGACGGPLPDSVCGLPTDRTLPLALSLARSAVTVAIDTCSPSCPEPLVAAAESLRRADAGLAEVCSAVEIARTVPCIQCAAHLDSIDTLAGCAHDSP